MSGDVERLEASGTAIFVPDTEHVWVPATILAVLDDVGAGLQPLPALIINAH